MKTIDYRELAYKIFCFGAMGILLIAFFKYALGYIFPFLFAWGIGYLVYPIAYKLSSRIKISRKLCSFVLVFSFLVIICGLLFFLGNRLLFEIQNLLNTISNNEQAISEYIQGVFDFISSIGERLPIANKLQNSELLLLIKENVNKLISSVWDSLIKALGSAVPDLAAGIVTSLPSLLLSGLITIISCFYFAMDVDLINKKMKGILPAKAVEYLSKIKRRLGNGFKKYIKAYVLIFLITFAELFLGFWILKLDYAFVLALLIAFLDFLPLIGTGAILLPWGIVLLLMNNLFQGMGILIIFAITTIVRQIIEPKIVGDSLGVHPLITLVSIYLGYRIFGFLGMVLAPMIVLLLLSKENGEQVKS